jgi:hypothetical protein
VLQEATGQIFDRGVEACRAAGLLKHPTLSAAIDTTPILGRGAVRDTPTTSSRMGSGTSWTRPAGSRAGSERRSWRPRD